MKNKNYFWIVLPVTIVIIVFMIDMVFHGVNNSHLEYIYITLIIYFILYSMLISIIKYRVIATYRNKDYVKTIAYSTYLTKMIFDKNSYLYSNSFLYISLSYLFQGQFYMYEKNISNVTHKKCIENKLIWECYYLLISKDFKNLGIQYHKIQGRITEDSNFYYIDCLFKGAILYSQKNYEDAKRVLSLNKQKFISEFDQNVYHEIITSIEKI